MTARPTPPLMSGAARLRALLATGEIVAAPGAPDALTARLVERAGFPAVYMTGLGATAARLGQPDLGLMTQGEMADHARAMVRAVRVPVIADADTGYGGPLNVRRTVAEYTQAGVAALHLEDQESPKRCGQLAGLRLVSRREAEMRIAAAVAAREETGSDLMIMGRTDALRNEGLSAALDRAKSYRDQGADLAFVDGVRTRTEVEGIGRGLAGPKVVSLVDGTDAASLTRAELTEMGFSVVLYAVTTLFAACTAIERALAHLATAGRPDGITDQASYADFCDIVGLSESQEFASRHEP
ncbi:isocitrate lyase/PEP mutase family protein [Aquibium sp. ELW1220]|uniref:isocitrate lyase/PEP mutase family protein n=1 Tax=Aquibium sp. ELW1220 TaxID=2976766 RepID=UPI0025AF148C|nr:isocitrate lyase/PEP mutase family protein [Aquibium sp. ELW1220]MDN2581507.1 isocitrate lyase/PEP mutase family protein [Aquibium sp. ELW1220]